MKVYKADFNVKKLKNLPIDRRINKLIDIIDLIVNKAFGGGVFENLYNELHFLLETQDQAKYEIKEIIEDDPS